MLIVGVTSYLNRGSIAEKKKMQRNARVTLLVDDKQVKTVDLEYVRKKGTKTFDKKLDTSDSGPEQQTYTGVLLKKVIQAVGISLSDKSEVIVKAIDGYTVALTAAEVRKDDNVYLVFKNNGQYLRDKSEGGSGPYRIVIRDDQFGQRWCKFVMEVNVK